MSAHPTPARELVDLTGKTAVVTGGAVGIGYGIAYRLAEAGANVVVADLDGEAAESAAKQLREHGFTATATATDVAEEDSVTQMINAAVDTYGGVDILVNNAGIYPNVLVMNMTAHDFDRVLGVNLRGVSSAGLGHYDASKHGVWGFTKNVAIELAPHGIWVNAIAPGAIATPGVAAAQSGAQTPAGVDMHQLIEAFLVRIPMRRMGEPDDIGRAALFLASDLASYVTGSQIVVDGGVLLT